MSDIFLRKYTELITVASSKNTERYEDPPINALHIFPEISVCARCKGLFSHGFDRIVAARPVVDFR